MATLFVTVLNTELETAVETIMFPVKAGTVTVLEPATAGTLKVTVPLVSPDKTIELIIYPYKTTQRLPLGTVTVTPEFTVIGPELIALLPELIE